LQQQPAQRGPLPDQPGTVQKPSGPGDTPRQAQPAQPRPDMREPARVQQPQREGPPARATESKPGGPAVQLSVEQRTRIRQVIVSQRVERTARVNFDIRIGTRVPRAEVRLFPVPVTVIEIVPQYRGYLYFVYEDEIVIVDPVTLEIVAVLPA
jgi:hypothetical protein